MSIPLSKHLGAASGMRRLRDLNRSAMRSMYGPRLCRRPAAVSSSSSSSSSIRFMQSPNVRGTRIATMNFWGFLPLLLWQDQLGRRRGPGRGGLLEFGYWSFFGIWSLGFGAFDR